MITLFTSGSRFGLPDSSPFVIKTMTDLRMTNIAYAVKPMKFSQAPKGKVPYIEDQGSFMGDSLFIREHLTERCGADFSAGYAPETLALGWAIERMMEEHFSFLLVCDRWLADSSFQRGPAHFFDVAPAPLRPAIRAFVRSRVRKAMNAQGMGRHTESERLFLAQKDLDAVERLLGDKPFLLGTEPCGVDSTTFAMLWSVSAKHFQTPLSDHLRSITVLQKYIERMQKRYFPDFEF